VVANLKLPKDFIALEKFAEAWCLASQTERHQKRVTSEMKDLEAFYAAMLPRIDAIAEYLNKFPLEDVKDKDQNLLYLALSFIEVSLAVELFHEPAESRAFAHGRYEIIESLTS
jgi:hypothetical protein